MKSNPRWIPLALCAVVLAWFAISSLPPKETGAHLHEFGKLPVLLNGRVQPWDSVARNTLLQLRNKQTVYLGNRVSMPAIQWLMEVLADPEKADTRPVFRIDNPELLGMLRLPVEEKHFTFDALKPSLSEIQKQFDVVRAKESKLRTPFERQVAKLYQALTLYHRLKNTLQPENSANFQSELAAFRANLPASVQAVQAREKGESFDQSIFNRAVSELNRYDQLANAAYVLAVPPADPAAPTDDWLNVGRSILLSIHEPEMPEPVTTYARLTTAYRQDNVEQFNAALAEYQDWLAARQPTAVSKAEWEVVFNDVQPFYRAMELYVIAALMLFFFWFKMTPWLQRSAFYLLLLAFGIHTFGLVFRMVLEGRPPVTNLYSSAIFIGWGSVLLGLVLERLFRDGLGGITGALIGFMTLIIAHHLSLGGDTMEMMRAVLDSNFWLATHVVTITIGYSATFFAGVLGILLIVRGVYSRSLKASAESGLGQMIYGIICFATFFSFVGTVLGGIWADQSWGRFWGWDPKENGALIIVLWNAIILHARWGRMVRDRGLAVMAVFGNIVTSYSWFGVNMLGVGLHAYGFMDQAFLWLIFFVISQCVLMVSGLLPRAYWASFEAVPRDQASLARWVILAGSLLTVLVSFFVGAWGFLGVGALLLFVGKLAGSQHTGLRPQKAARGASA